MLTVIVLTEDRPKFWLVWPEAVDFYMNCCSLFSGNGEFHKKCVSLLCLYSKLSLSILGRTVGLGCLLKFLLSEGCPE